MMYDELRCIIGENCDDYDPKDKILMLSMGLSSVSCDNCINYNNETCHIGKFDHLKNKITNN
ncbi:hypothetical protein [Clostridium manihotivorum]|uniref:Uncharacterized protein n=1 Tax=Clostridium manihotivorum TaxID=2320868 RepID=A0A410DMG4_9CLOT|nr:hypothetical protein [Clostridium manihotivorum]QAA30256.1 hypothetical protein C1I91_00330 [Clostridium manihotivorum]